MADKKEVNMFEALQKIGLLAGVGEEWYQVGEAEKNDDGATVYPVYAKSEEIADKVDEVFNRLIGEEEE